MKKGNLIYLDNAATTKPDPLVIDAMLPYLTEGYGNASAKYSIGYDARAAINEARKNAAALIGCEPDEIIFTSGGTESDNMVLRGMLQKKGHGHIIISAIEHPAILNTARQLESEGVSVSVVPVDGNGRVSPEQIEKYIRQDTILISVMMANNEIGTVEHVEEIGRIAHEHEILFHTDAVQALGSIPINVDRMNIDFLSASSHKLYGPKGAGFLYVKRRTGLKPFIFGGGQEMGMRSGTENTAAIAGFGEACRLALSELQERAEKERQLRDYLAERLLSELDDIKINGVWKNETDNATEISRLPGNLNISFKGIQGSSLVLRLDMKKICVSTGSACAAGGEKSSHVLEAIGLDRQWLDGSLRVSIGKYNTFEEISAAADAIVEIVTDLRGMQF